MDCEACSDSGCVRDPRSGAGGGIPAVLAPCPVCTPRPCPFCGGHAYTTVIRKSDGVDLPVGFECWDVQCDACHASLAGRKTKAHAVSDWNRRVALEE